MTQKELDLEMQRINLEWHNEKKIYEDEYDEIVAKKNVIYDEIQKKYHELHHLEDKQRELNRIMKEINVKYNDRKHVIYVANSITK